MTALVYKILSRAEWAQAQAAGLYNGSADDVRDGFIHFSTADQAAGTLAKHFRGRDDLVLLEFDPAALGDALRWEPSRGGALFPHLHGPLDTTLVREIRPLGLGQDGHHILPDGLG